MESSVKKFLIKVKKADQFLFWQIYYHPEVLHRLILCDPLEYYKDAIYNRLILNNDFWRFIALALTDNGFIFRLDDKILAVFETIIKDSLSFKSEFLTFIEELKKAKPKVSKTAITRQMQCNKFIYLIACQQECLFPGLDLQRKALDYDDESAQKVSSGISSFQLYLDPRNYVSMEYEILNLIAKNQFFTDHHLWLEKPEDETSIDDHEELADEEMFYHLLCSNNFLKLVEDKINKNDLPSTFIMEAIDIIDYSIYIKTHLGQITPHYKLFIGLKKISAFDLERAHCLIGQLKHAKEVAGSSPHLKLIRSNAYNEQES